MSRVTIVMYHYVRELEHSRYPGIKGLPVDHFREQVEYLLKNYNIIRMETLVESVLDKKSLPERAALLTFDDGYRDHFDFVFPVLDERGVQGSFFPPARAIEEHRVLDVNKIHFILASVKDSRVLIEEIFAELDANRRALGLEENSVYYERLASQGKYDPKEVMFVKRMLQRELPAELRADLVNRLFRRYVSDDEESFSRELYMTTDQLRCLRRKGMYVGSHGYRHLWLNTVTREEQSEEVDRSLKFLRDIGGDVKDWVMCYPHGAHDQQLLELLRQKRCAVGLTTRVDVADLGVDNALTLPRLDTNNLPKNRNGSPVSWKASPSA